MNEGLEILPLDILFQRLHHNITTTQSFLQKMKFYHFWWLAPENSKNQLFTQKLVKHQILRNRIKNKILIWSFYGA